MSNICPKPDAQTDSETLLLRALDNLALSGATQAIQKNGGSSFKNVDLGSGGGFTILPATGAVDGSNVTFTYTKKPSYIVIDGGTYPENTRWTWSGLTATYSVPPIASGDGGFTFGIA